MCSKSVSAAAVTPTGSQFGSSFKFHSKDYLSEQLSVYYRIYHKDGAIATKRPAYSNDAYIGRIRSKWVAPPSNTAGSLKLCLSSMENIDPNKATLFATPSSNSALVDNTPISLKSNQTLGTTPEEPLALLSEAWPEEGMKPGTERFRVPPDNQSPPSPRICRFSENFENFELLTYAFAATVYYGVYSEAGAIESKAPIDSEEPWVSRINVDLIPPPVSVKSLLRLLALQENITTACQLLNGDGLTRLDDNHPIFMDDGNWFGATVEDRVLLKFTSRPQLLTKGFPFKTPNSQSRPSPRFCRFLVNCENFELLTFAFSVLRGLY
jgi:hypothetical protein